MLCVEALNETFAKKFWDFVKAGGYKDKQKSSDKRLFYRFRRPTDPSFPVMLELFSRVPDAIDIPEQSQLTPIPISDEVSSLSAILLDDAYYSLIHERKRIFDGLTIIGAECLIPLKARAYTDLSERQQSGERIDSKDIKKHKNDIFRLYTVLDPSSKFTIEAGIKSDLEKAFGLLKVEIIDLKALGVTGTTASEVLKELEEFYGLNR